ncbi:unnamed protein product [Calypogeia fissa]
MYSRATTWKLTSDEKVKRPDLTISFTVFDRGSVYAGYPWRDFSRPLPFGVNDSYFFRVSALFVIICLGCCIHYFAYVRRRPLRQPVDQAEPEPDDPAKVAAAKMNAALAARWRQETLAKSGAEEEARKVAAERAARQAAEFSKPWPRNRGKGGSDSPLQWQVGTATRRGFM